MFTTAMQGAALTHTTPFFLRSWSTPHTAPFFLHHPPSSEQWCGPICSCSSPHTTPLFLHQPLLPWCEEWARSG
jgi:hypothetical protein